MPPLDFPSSPITGATYTGPNGVIWAYDGAKWVNGTQIGTAYAPISSPVFTGNPTAPNPPSGDADTSVATTAFVSAAVAPAFNGVGRNYIHNPLFNVAQRGAGPWAANGYTLDRWAVYGTGTYSVSQQAFALAGLASDEEARYVLTNVFTGLSGAADYLQVLQMIENVLRLANKTITVSFWAAAASGTPKLGVSLDQSFGTGGSPSTKINGAGQSVTISTTYTRYSLTFALPSVSGKTLGTNGDHLTELNLWYSSGANNATRAGSIGVQSGTISLWGVQLEVGSVATPLEKPDPRYDLANCQRFYSGTYFMMGGYAASVGNSTWNTCVFPVSMRATPTVTFSGWTYANSNTVSLVAAVPGSATITINATAVTTVWGQGYVVASAEL